MKILICSLITSFLFLNTVAQSLLNPENSLEIHENILMAQQDFLKDNFKEVIDYYDSYRGKQVYLSIETYKMSYLSCLMLSKQGYKSEYFKAKAHNIVESFKFWNGVKRFNEQWEKLDVSLKINNQIDTPKAVPKKLKKYLKHINQNVNYPNLARRMKIKGTVYVHVIINKDGSLSSVKSIQGLGAGCDEEAERVVSEIPNFGSVTSGDKPIYERKVIPLKFK